MALNAYLKLKGQKSGEIKGSVTQKGREGKIMVIAVSHDIISPRDAASGLPTGKRVHKPFVITKPIDKATPILYSMLVSNENIPEWKLKYWRSSRGGQEQQYFTIELMNASIASIHHEMLNNTYVENSPLEVRETIAFTYQKITWTYVDGGITASDDWEAPDA